MDQVTPLLGFVLITIGIQKAATDLCFSHPDAGSEKKGSIKICLGQRGIQPNIAVIFRGTGRSIAGFFK